MAFKSEISQGRAKQEHFFIKLALGIFQVLWQLSRDELSISSEAEWGGCPRVTRRMGALEETKRRPLKPGMPTRQAFPPYQE